MFSEVEITALSLSLKVAITATLIALPFAVAAAYLMARSEFRGKVIVDTLLHLPLVVPPVVIGYLLLLAFAPTGTFGGWLADMGLSPAFKWQGAAIASGVMAFPLMVRSIRQAFEAEPSAYRDAAFTLGLSRLAFFRKVSLPLAAPGILAGSVLGFARAVGEFGATITFVANIPGLTQTLPLALYNAAHSPGGEAAAMRFAFLCLIPALGSLMLSEWITRRSKGAQR